ncbi:MAG TPA: hypothetical protein VF964_01650, partial [Vicinamibacteria bacterium]
EEMNVQTFLSALRTSIEEFLADPLGTPLVPNWARVWAGLPDAGPRLLTAVQRGAQAVEPAAAAPPARKG